MYSPNQGVWHPDLMQPTIFWNGGAFCLDTSFGFINPSIEINQRPLVEYFTEQVDNSIQFALTQYGNLTEATRSNQAIANQKTMPKCFKKAQWLTFGSLRAYPNQQLQKLCAVLNDRTLPLNEPIVLTLIRQILYHIGAVQAQQNEIFPIWKTDMFKGQFLDAITKELRDLSSEIALKPSQHQCMFALIEISRFVAQWNNDCISVLRSFLTTIESWVKDCDAQIEQAPADDVPSLRAKKAVFHHYAIFCFSRGQLTNDDITKLLQSLVSAQNEAKFKNDSIYENQLQMLISYKHRVMAELIGSLVQKINSDPQKRMLTDAVKKIISKAENLQWQNIPFGNEISCCFEARDGSNNLYSINILNGIVLYNGTPPSQLPSTILRHTLYKRTFKDRNFETCSSGNTFETVHPSHGRRYRFKLEGKRLTITEKDPETSEQLVILDSCSLHETNSWGYKLPLILKQNYSHWYSSKYRIIFFRGQEFYDRDIDFILKLSANQWHCYRVHSHRKKDNWKTYLNSIEQSFDELVQIESPILSIMEKFEKREYIHCYLSPDGMIRYHYPRFDLEFFFHPNLMSADEIILPKLKSRDYTGYFLSSNQQLHDTLLGFKQYLILEHETDGDRNAKVIISRGDVAKTDDGVIVKSQEGPAVKLEVFTYEVHPRFQNLSATSIHARIHLADLYAACSTLAPETRMQMTGSEVAMQLIRRSWTNRPLEVTDYSKLQSLPAHSQFTPGLDLLSLEVASSSLQTEFLHTQNPLKLEKVFPKKASVEYFNEDYPRNVRKSLTPIEEKRILGQNRPAKMKKNVIVENSKSTCCTRIERQKDETACFENILFFRRKTKPKEGTNFLFNANNGCSSGTPSNLYKSMVERLKNSHDAFNQIKHESLTPNYQKEHSFKYLFEQIVKKRELIEFSSLQSLSSITDCCSYRAANFRILRSANIHPTLTLEDLVKCAMDRNWIKHFNPFLTQENADALIHNIIVWMKYCVLGDKVRRLIGLYRSYQTHTNTVSGHTKAAVELQILQELAVYRSWPAAAHPDWLAFEVIAQLQIRPVQYTVAKSLIEGVEKQQYGPITQLNMGEGKTRVILPMLAMYWKNSSNLVRFNFLSALLQEAGEYLHKTVTATVINIPIFYFPFNRDVCLDAENVKIFYSALKHCQQVGRVILCAPEHRQSLKLKWFEKKGNDNTLANNRTVEPNGGSLDRSSSQAREKEANEHDAESNEDESEDDLKDTDSDTDDLPSDVNQVVCRYLDRINSMKYVDVLDEVDEILRTKNKLIYAVGQQIKLPSKESRLNVMQALLGTISSSEKVRRLLSDPTLVQGEVGSDMGSFKEFRIIPGETFTRTETRFIQILLEELIRKPPSN